jgi:hypothetical protein
MSAYRRKAVVLECGLEPPLVAEAVEKLTEDGVFDVRFY